MGRLQRKKTSDKKQGKKTGPDAAVKEQTPQDLAVLSGTSGDKPKEVAKKPTLSRKKSPAGSKPSVVKSEKNYMNQAMQFLREVKVELKKVTWPTKKQTIGSTAVVIILVMIISLFLGVVDIGLSSLIRIVLK
jgi:preprotein translocase subunit SecE